MKTIDLSLKVRLRVAYEGESEPDVGAVSRILQHAVEAGFDSSPYPAGDFVVLSVSPVIGGGQ